MCRTNPWSNFSASITSNGKKKLAEHKKFFESLGGVVRRNFVKQRKELGETIQKLKIHSFPKCHPERSEGTQ